MSTRGVIARLKSALPLRFAGRYHHWDSYPTGLGKALWELYHGHFDHDLEAMLKVLLDEHPAGWSQINGADFRCAPGFKEWYFTPESVAEPKLDEKDITGSQPQCYCHGDRAESEMLLTEANATGSGCEWAYVFLPASKPHYEVMLILSSYTPKGQKMIGFFGQGDSRAFWTVVALVGLQGKEPDWWKLEIGAPLETLSHSKPLGQDTLSMALENKALDKTALGIGPSVHPDRGRPGTYIILTPAKGPHYVGVQQDRYGVKTYYCTCSPVEDKPSPDCQHSLLVCQYLKDREQAAKERWERGLEYTCQRLENSNYAFLVWEAGRPRFLLLEQSHYLLSGFPTRGNVDQISVFALAILLDFTGDEVTALSHYEMFARFMTEGVVSPDTTTHAVAAENESDTSHWHQSHWWCVCGQQISEFLATQRISGREQGGEQAIEEQAH